MWPPPPRHVVEKLRPLSGNCIAFEEPPRKSSPSSIWYCLIPKWPNYCVWWICLNLWLLICKYLWSLWIWSFWPWHWQRTLIIRSNMIDWAWVCMPHFIFLIQCCKIIIQDIKLREHSGLMWTGEISVTYFYNHNTLMEFYRYNVKKLNFCQFSCEFDKEYIYGCSRSALMSIF